MAPRVLVVLLALLTPLLAGCPSATQPGNAASQQAPAKPATEPRTALREMLAAYAQAKGYSDKGIVRLSFKQHGQKQGDTWPCSLSYSPPNQLALHAFQVTVVCDGESLHAEIEDKATHNLDGQMVERPAPKQLRLTHLSSDAVLYDLLSSRLGRIPMQLDLLLGNEMLAGLLEQAEIAGFEPAEWEKHWCDRIMARLDGGEFVFWIDQESHLLRRLDYPVASIFPKLAGNPEIRELTLSAEMREASFGALKPGEFAYVPPRNSKPVEAFVTPPPPAPTSLLGKKKGEFSFLDLEGKRVSPDSWLDRAAVLLWYGHHAACEAELPQFAEVAADFKDESKLAFYAVCAESSETTNDRVRDQLAAWQAELPVVRDLDAVGRDVFAIEELPTLVVLDDQNVVQYVERGANGNLVGTLPRILERLLAGDNLAQEVLDRAARDRTAYEGLIAKGGAATTQVIEVPQTAIKAASPPTALKLRQIWSLDRLQQPGNITIVSEEGAGELLVCEGHRAVARIDREGKLLGRQALELPEGTICTYVRTIQDNEGNRFYAICGPLGAQCLVFNAGWKQLFAYPSADQKHDGIRDVRLADLDHDGAPELYLGFWGVTGVHALDLQGDRLWINRDFQGVTSLAVSVPNEIGWRRLLVTGDSGGILKLNKLGHRDPEQRVSKWPLGLLVASDFDATQAQYMGLSQDERTGQLVAVALSADFQPQWDYPLPPGVHNHPLEFLQPAPLLADKRGAWLIAGADGTVHVVSEDGEFSDSFAVGSAITGLACGRFGEQRLLLVATEQSVTAWEVQ